MNNERVKKDTEESTIVSAGSSQAEHREVKVKNAPKVFSLKESLSLRIAKSVFRFTLKLLKVLFICLILAVLGYALYYAYVRARGKDISEFEKASPSVEEKTAPEKVVNDAQTIIYDPDSLKNFGTLRLSSTPIATVILLNGKKMVYPNGKNVTAPNEKLLLPPGEYRMTLINTPLGFSRTKSITIRKGEEKPLVMILKRD